MSHKAALEALDKTLRDLRGNNILMGGVTLLIAGDFRQTLPVIPRGTKADQLKACIKASYLWQHVKQLKLIINMRVHLHRDQSAARFSQKLLQISDGIIPLDPADSLHILPCENMVSSLEEFKAGSLPTLSTTLETTSGWETLAPKNNAVNKVNGDLLSQLPGTAGSYRSGQLTLSQNLSRLFTTQ